MPRWAPDARLRLVEAAIDLFAEQGYERTGVAEIASRAGLTKTTFFRHFPDKREVLFAGQQLHDATLRAAITDAPADVEPVAAVRIGLRALAQTLPPQAQAYGARLRAVIAANSELQERSALKRRSNVEAISAALIARGVGHPQAAVAADLAMLAFDSAYAEWTEAEPGTDLAELVDVALSGVLQAAAAIT